MITAARRLRPVMCLGIALLCAGVAGASADSFAWKPGWKKGDYWVVRSPLARHVPAGDSTLEDVNDGYYYTRFLVKRVASLPNHPTLAVLDARYRENNDFSFEQRLEALELVVDMSSLRVIRYRMLGNREDGSRIDDQVNTDPAQAAFFTFEAVQWMAIPDTLHIAWPIFSGTTGGYDLRDRIEHNYLGAEFTYSQRVDASANEALVHMWYGTDAEHYSYPLALPRRDDVGAAHHARSGTEVRAWTGLCVS